MLEKTRTLAAERSYKSVVRVMTRDNVITTRTAWDARTVDTFDQVRKRPGAASAKTPSINAKMMSRAYLSRYAPIPLLDDLLTILRGPLPKRTPRDVRPLCNMLLDEFSCRQFFDNLSTTENQHPITDRCEFL